MKNKVIKVFLALVSLLIGFIIVHSVSPTKEETGLIKTPLPQAFEFKYGADIALQCIYGSEPYVVHFSAYQRPDVKVPGVNYQHAFCDKLPGPGVTLVTLDFINEDLRERPVAIKFLHHESSAPSLGELFNGQVVNESFHSSIPRGFIQSRLDLSKAGFYTLVIEVGGGVVSDNEVVKIPFEVEGRL